MREHIPRWTHASIRDYIKTAFAGVPILVEGENDKKPSSEFFIELRIDGPNMTNIGTKVEYMGMVEVNLLLTVNKNEKYVNTLQDKIGLCFKHLDKCIPIRKIGSTQDVDDGSFVSVLQLLDEDIEINVFGQVDPTVAIQQASVEAHYRFQITLED